LLFNFLIYFRKKSRSLHWRYVSLITLEPKSTIHVSNTWRENSKSRKNPDHRLIVTWLVSRIPTICDLSSTLSLICLSRTSWRTAEFTEWIKCTYTNYSCARKYNKLHFEVLARYTYFHSNFIQNLDSVPNSTYSWMLNITN